MSGVAQYLDSIKFNGRSLGAGGQVDATAGGFTQSNAPFIFAALLRDLAKPGGPLSTLAQDKIFAGQVESAISGGRGLRTDTLRKLASAGVNEAQAMQQVAGVDQQVLAGISAQRSDAERELQSATAEAKTQLANVTSQSEDIQKQRQEDLRRFNKLYKNLKKQQQFSNILGVASLALNFIPGIGTALGIGAKAAQGGVNEGLGETQDALSQQSAFSGGQDYFRSLSANAGVPGVGGPQLGSGIQGFASGFGLNPAAQGGLGNYGGAGPIQGPQQLMQGLDPQTMSLLANFLSNSYLLQGGNFPGQR